MKPRTEPIPFAIYIHLPWCLRKCPYCDFNSHEFRDTFAEKRYVNALISDIQIQKQFVNMRSVDSIFFGGGTPSLFSASAVSRIIDACANSFSLSESVEITLEANPGAADQDRFQGYRSAGVNRLSIGVQSFSNTQLQKLGRIHDADDAHTAIKAARRTGFDNINVDLMYDLPEQTVQQALTDLQTALNYQPEHISYYQLTIEPNTVFAKLPPKQSEPDVNDQMQIQAIALLHEQHYERYEVSAFSRNNRQCRHNLNYWQYGDYLGVGAGAHGKITNLLAQQVFRTQNKRMPDSYMQAIEGQQSYQKTSTPLPADDLRFEFLLNALRLTHGISTDKFAARTFLTWQSAHPATRSAVGRGLLQDATDRICTTELGYRHLNDTLACFLPD